MGRATGGPLNSTEARTDATAAVAAARRGRRRDVESLIHALEGAALIVPLAKRIDDVELGVVEEVGEELSLSPHLLFDAERLGYLPVFTRDELVERATREVGWDTGGEGLEYCSLPSRVVLELGLALLEDPRVAGVLVNPFDATELVLRRHEVASIVQGHALPLVGYVAEIPIGEDEGRLVAELDAPPPAVVVDAIEDVLRGAHGLAGYSLHRTFNPERDLEPHLTINVRLHDDGADRAALAERLAAALDGKLPPPGYVDILFDDPTLG